MHLVPRCAWQRGTVQECGEERGQPGSKQPEHGPCRLCTVGLSRVANSRAHVLDSKCWKSHCKCIILVLKGESWKETV